MLWIFSCIENTSNMEVKLILFALNLFLHSTCVAVDHIVGPLASPYFFLCSYHGFSDQLNLDANDLVLNVAIDGNPAFYEPDAQYTGTVLAYQPESSSSMCSDSPCKILVILYVVLYLVVPRK